MMPSKSLYGIFCKGVKQMHKIRDGDLYKIVEIDGVEFKIYYGYLSDSERMRGWEPYPVYPDFTKDPQYTKSGEAFATAFQGICKYYEPRASGESWCDNCGLFDKRDTYIGICKCPNNKKLE